MWFNIIKEWDLSQRWKQGEPLPSRPNLTDEEMIKTLEYVLEQYQRLTEQDSSVEWMNEFFGIHNAHYIPIAATPISQAKTSDNEHIKMLVNDIKLLLDGPHGYDKLYRLIYDEDKNVPRDELGLIWRTEHISDYLGERSLYGDE